MENSDEEQDKYGNFERNSISSNTNVGAAYTSTREDNPPTELQNQEETDANKIILDTHNSLNPEKPNRKQLPQTRTQSNDEEFDILQRKWRDLTKRKEAHEAETAAMLQALETSLFAKEGIPTSKDQQPVKKMQDCHPSIAPSENRETCPDNPRPLSTQVGQTVGRERESLWPGKPPGTENSQNVNRIQPSFGKQTQTLDEN